MYHPVFVAHTGWKNAKAEQPLTRYLISPSWFYEYGYLELCSHAFGSWGSISSSTHSRTCSKCGYKDLASHTGVWQDTSTSEHTRTCGVCKAALSEAHKYSTATNRCTVCGRTGPITAYKIEEPYMFYFNGYYIEKMKMTELVVSA